MLAGRLQLPWPGDCDAPWGHCCGHVPITVSFGSYSVIVSPGSSELELGGTVQLDAEVLDQNGQIIADVSALGWATNAPAVALVDATGLVTGVIPGTATIVATYEGVAGIAIITVTGVLADADEDGWTSDVDCDDTDPTVYPGATEVVDGKDSDCDGAVDNTLADGITFVVTAESDLQVLRADGVTAVSLGLPVPGEPRDPDYSPDGSRIAFSLGGNIYVMNVDASGLTQLTSGETDSDPAWSSDATRIVFARTDGFGIPVLHVMNADGSGVTPLVDGSQPDWSPDGSRIAFVQGPGPHVYVMNADGTAVTRLTSTTASSEWDPAWSPDGSRIAFRWGCDAGTDEGCGISDLAEIYVINADGSNLIQLTDDPGYDNLEPTWSPTAIIP